MLGNTSCLSAALVAVSLYAYTIATTNPPIAGLYDALYLNQGTTKQSINVEAKVTKNFQKNLGGHVVEKPQYTTQESMALRIPNVLECVFGNLNCGDLRRAAQVCKDWSYLAALLHKRFHSMEIIYIVHLQRYDTCPAILKRYTERVRSGKDRKKDEWQPQLIMIFLPDQYESDNIYPIVRNLVITQPNCRSFLGSSFYPFMYTIKGEHNTQMFVKRRFTGFIFPEALLAQPGVHVDIIFPTLEQLENGLELFTGKPEENKKMFQKLYGWKSEYLIKFAIVMSRPIPPNEPRKKIDGSYRRAKEVTRWLKSLPESGNMAICVTLDDNKWNKPSYGKESNPSLAVILFGGSAVHVSAYMRSLSNSSLWESREFVNWMAVDLQKEMPKVSQDVSLIIRDRSSYVSTEEWWFPRAAFLTYHWKICGLEREETDIAMLDESLRQNYFFFFFKIGFQ